MCPAAKRTLVSRAQIEEAIRRSKLSCSYEADGWGMSRHRQTTQRSRKGQNKEARIEGAPV